MQDGKTESDERWVSEISLRSAKWQFGWTVVAVKHGPHGSRSSFMWIFVHVDPHPFGSSSMGPVIWQRGRAQKGPPSMSGIKLEMLAHLDFTASPTHAEIIAQLARAASRLLLERAGQAIKAREKLLSVIQEGVTDIDSKQCCATQLAPKS